MTPAEIAAMVVDADDWFRVNGNHPVRGDELAKHVRALAAECARLQRSVDVNIELRILGGRAGTDFIKQRDQAESRAAEARDKSRRAAQIIIEEIGSIGPEDGDEAAKRSVAEIRKMRAQLEAVTRERHAAVNDANRQKYQHERLRVSFAVALGLLSEMEYWRQLTGTRFEAPLRNFLADMRAGR